MSTKRTSHRATCSAAGGRLPAPVASIRWPAPNAVSAHAPNAGVYKPAPIASVRWPAPNAGMYKPAPTAGTYKPAPTGGGRG